MKGNSFRERTFRSNISLYDELLPLAGLLKTGFIQCKELLKNRKCKHIFPKQYKITARCE